MAVSVKFYGQFPLLAFEKLITDMAGAGTTIKCALLTNLYTFNQDTHTSYNDLTNEVTGVGYTAGGMALTTKVLTYTPKTVTWNADPVNWPTSTITARYAVLYDDTPSGATNKKLILCIDFGEDRSTSGTTFTIAWNALGIFSASMA